MRFNLPDGVYKAEVAAEPLLNDEGEALDGVTDYSAKRIQVSPGCLLGDRPRTVYHEYAHPWIAWAGLPRTEEQFCDLFARMAESLMGDVMRQGGPDAVLLMDLVPEARFDAACLVLTLAELGEEKLVQCGRCTQRIGGGSVCVSPPRHSPEVGGLVVELAFYCESCDRVQRWTEFASKTGRPTGAMASKPVFLGGAERDGFLAEHGGKVGCVVRD
jgi:hypothetical protein